MPRLNARRFEERIVGRVQSSVLNEGIATDLPKAFAQELDGVIRERRGRQDTIESELMEARRQMDRLWRIIGTAHELRPTWVLGPPESGGDALRLQRKWPRPSSLIGGRSGPSWRPSWQASWT